MSADAAALIGLAHEQSAAFAERESELDAAGRYPSENIRDLFDRGFFAATLPAALGGAEIALADYVEIVRILAHGSPSTALLYVMPSALVAVTRIPEALVPEAHRAPFREQSAWIAGEVAARKIFAVANSEPGAGGKISETKTTARKNGGDVLLNGKKSFCSFGRYANYFMCAARSDSGVDEFLVARGAAGLDVGTDWTALGMRSTESVSLTLHDTPAVALLGYPGMLERANARHWSTLGFAATFLGAGEALYESGRSSPGAQKALSRSDLAAFRLFLEAGRSYLREVARGEHWPISETWKKQPARVKTFITRGVSDHAVAMLNVGGGAAYVGRGSLQRLARDAMAGPFLRPPLPLALEEMEKEILADPPITG